MKKYGVVIAVVFLLVPLSMGATSKGNKRYHGKKESYAPGHVLVKYRTGTGESEKSRIRGSVDGRKGKKFRHIGVEKLHLPVGVSEKEAVEFLSQDPAIEYVELDWKVKWLSDLVVYAAMPSIDPGDPDLFRQWYLEAPPFSAWFATSANPVDVDVDIDAPEGWAVMAQIIDSTMTVTLGIVDSGMGSAGYFSAAQGGYIPGHQDLPPSTLYVNQVEASGTIGVDDDGNGLLDDVNGFDWYTSDDIEGKIIDDEWVDMHTFEPDDNIPGEDNEPADAFTTDQFHGTLISGLVAAAWNGTGISGIGEENLKILPLRGSKVLSDILLAFDTAIDTVGGATPVKVINASWTFSTSPQSLKDSIKTAGQNGIVVVAAAANDSNLYFPFDSAGAYSGIQHIANNDDFINRVFPAEYTRDSSITNVLTVTSTGQSGVLSDFSNVGPHSIQIAAPGENIYSTAGGSNGYSVVHGTSFSAPIAGAVLGLLMAANPGLTPAGAIDNVIQGGEFDDRLAGLVQSGKRVNLAGALAPFYPYSGLAYLDGDITISIYTDSISQSYGTIVSATVDPAFSTSPEAAVIVSIGGGSYAVSPLAPGIAQFTLTFGGASAPVGTYDTGPWRVTAIRPFTAQVNLNETISFSSLLLSGDVSWAVTDTTVATISSSGVLTGLSEGMTRVILSVDSVERDYSGWVLIQSSSAFSGGSSGGGCCGTMSSPGDPYIPGLVEMMLVGTILMLIRRRYRTALVDPRSKVQDPRRG